jgi:RND family efflux transporter MFP subunit
VAVAHAVEQEIAATQTVLGTVQPARRSVVGSAVDGRVIEFLVENGDAVKQGDKLAQLRTDTLAIELSAAQAELRLREEELTELQNGAEPEQLASLEAVARSAAAHKEYALAQYERMQSLFSRGQAATQYQLEEARSQATQAEQDYLSAKALHELGVRGPRAERLAQAAAHRDVQSEQVRLLQEQIKLHTLVAPFEGYVVAEHSEVGQWAARGAPIVEVVQLSEVDVRVNLIEAHVAGVSIGDEVEIRVPACRQADWRGRIHRIVPQADVRSRTFPVEIRVMNRIDENGPVLMSGMLAQARLATGGQMTALLVPKDALVLGGPQPVVFAVEGPGNRGETTVRSVSVTLGVAVGDAIQVTGPLRAGERVVVQGNERLQSGQSVTILNEASAK